LAHIQLRGCCHCCHCCNCHCCHCCHCWSGDTHKGVCRTSAALGVYPQAVTWHLPLLLSNRPSSGCCCQVPAPSNSRTSSVATAAGCLHPAAPTHSQLRSAATVLLFCCCNVRGIAVTQSAALCCHCYCDCCYCTMCPNQPQFSCYCGWLLVCMAMKGCCSSSFTVGRVRGSLLRAVDRKLTASEDRWPGYTSCLCRMAWANRRRQWEKRRG
jgi:hypothetical protein